MHPEIEQFIETTRNVIQEDGFDDYLPTLLFPDRYEIYVLEAEFDSDNHEAVVQDWLADQVGDEDNFLVAFKIDPQHFKLLGRLDDVHHERVYSINH